MKGTLFICGIFAMVTLVTASQLCPTIQSAGANPTEAEIMAAITMLGVNVNTTMTELNVTLTGGKTQIETLAAALLEIDVKSDLMEFVNGDTALLNMQRGNLLELRNCVSMFITSLKGTLLYRVSKLKHAELLNTLNNLNLKLADLQALFNTVDNKAKCELNKICYEEDIFAAETTFLTMWENVEALKHACTTFDVHCINAFNQYKVDFETFSTTTIDGMLRPNLTDICNMNCYGTENERFNYEKSLLTLDISVKGMISAIKFTVKHSILKRLNSIQKKLHVRKERLNILKLAVEDSITKDELTKAVAALTQVEFNTNDDKYSLDEVITTIVELKGWLLPEDFTEVSQKATRLAYRLVGLCKQIRDCLDYSRRKHNMYSFEFQISVKRAVVETETGNVDHFIKIIKSGRHSLCREESNTEYTGNIGRLITDLDLCKNELAQLNTTLFTEFKKFENFETYKTIVTQLIATNDADLTRSHKYMGFLNEYDRMFCTNVD